MVDSFKIENIKIPTIDFQAKLKIDDAMLELRTEIMGRVYTEIVELKSNAIRTALITLGWVPPADKCDRNHAELTICNDPECWLR